MSTTFSSSMRSLERDGFRFSLIVLLIAALLLVAWGAWFFLATVSVDGKVGILAFAVYVAALYSAQVFVGAWLG